MARAENFTGYRIRIGDEVLVADGDDQDEPTENPGMYLATPVKRYCTDARTSGSAREC